MTFTLASLVAVLQQLGALGFGKDDLKAIAQWFVDRFGKDYTEAERQNLLANGISYAEQIADLNEQIAVHIAAQNPPPPVVGNPPTNE